MTKQEALDKVKIIEDYLIDFKNNGFGVVFNTTADLKYQIEEQYK